MAKEQRTNNTSENQENSLAISAPAEVVNDSEQDEMILRPSNSVSVSATDSNGLNTSLQPHVPVSADQLQEWKNWLSVNDGQILAAMLRSLPTPVTRRINWGEFVQLFGLSYDPAENLSRELDNLTATFPEWVKRFNFSYMNLASATARVNSETEKFDMGLATIAEKMTNTARNGSEVLQASPFQSLFS